MANNALAPNIDNVLSDYVYAGRKLKEQRTNNMLNPRIRAAFQAATDVINRGSIAGTLGAPVDLANMALGAVGLGSENPVLGSEWIGQKMESAGMVSPERRPLAEFAAGFINPETAATKAALLASKSAPLHAMMVFHGTPHEFKNFDASKIGTGTGEQAYGHGIYLTEDPEVGKSYKLSTSKKTPATDEHISTDVEYYPGEDLQGHAADRAVSHVFRRGKHEYTFADGSIGEFDSSGNYTAYGPSEGHFLTVDLPDEKINLMLDWNKPLKEQKSVMSKLEKHWEEKFGDPDIVKQQLGLDENSIGSDLAMALGIGRHPEISKTSSMMLQSLGIPGIKYRSYDRLPKKGESVNPKHNYVVFPGEEQNLTILKRE